jgi:hypothetical protein
MGTKIQTKNHTDKEQKHNNTLNYKVYYDLLLTHVKNTTIYLHS